MDDIKETVRNSGEKLCRAVTSLTIRLCDVSLTDISHASQAMDIVLPVLLGEGILSKVDTIRKASIAVVMKLAKVVFLLLLLLLSLSLWLKSSCLYFGVQDYSAMFQLFYRVQGLHFVRTCLI